MTLLRFFTHPGALWPLKAVVLGFAFILVPLLWFPLAKAAFGPLILPAGGPELTETEVVLAMIVLAPIVETLAIAALYWLIVVKLKQSDFVFIGVVVILAGALHWPISAHRTPVSVALFAIFAVQMALWWRQLGATKAIGGVTLTHMVYNGFGAYGLASLWAKLLGPGA